MNYYKRPEMSRSKLCELDGNTPYFWFCKNIEKSIEDKDTKSLNFGRAFHISILEPQKIENEIVVEPTFNKRTNQGKADYAKFLEDNQKKIIISKSELEILQNMHMSLNLDRHKESKDILSKCDKFEDEFYFNLMGVDFKAKLDAINTKDHIIVDVKTCKKAFENSKKFAQEMINYHNAEQVYIYTEAYKQKYNAYPEFYFITFEKEKPFEIQIFNASQLYEYGEYKVRNLINKYNEHKEEFDKGFIKQKIQYAELPEWAVFQMDTVTLDFGNGEEVVL